MVTVQSALGQKNKQYLKGVFDFVLCLLNRNVFISLGYILVFHMYKQISLFLAEFTYGYSLIYTILL